MQHYHYDVYLRTSRGTVKRRVGVQRRSVKLATDTAKNAVQRTIREDCEVLDCVPLKRVPLSKPTTVGRGKRQMQVSRVQLVQTRRPKARPSVKLSQKGRLYVPNREEDKPYVSVTERMRDVQLPPEFGVCQSEGCIKRGTCRHPGLDVKRNTYLVYTTQLVKRGSKRAVRKGGWVWVIERDIRSRKQAVEHAKASMEDKGFKDVRVLDAFTAKQASAKGYSRKPAAYFEERLDVDTTAITRVS